MNMTDKKALIFGGIVLGGLVMMGGGAMAYKHYKERGIRNNNPGNLDYSKSNPWQGQVGSDGRFAIFTDPKYGIRALYRTLMTYRNKHALTTITGIINRWAPAVENNTAAYIAAVSMAVGKAPGETLALSDYPALVKAIIKHENGVMPYPDTLINQGIALA